VYKRPIHRKGAKIAKKCINKSNLNDFAIFAPLRLCAFAVNEFFMDEKPVREHYTFYCTQPG
jgi:hypothetical protein